MTLKAFRNPSSAAPDLNNLSRAVADFADQVTSKPIIDGVYIPGVVLDTMGTVPHSLGRRWVGFIVTNKSTFADVIANHNNTDTQTITMTASTTVTVDLWVF